MNEKQVYNYHKLTPITLIALLACFSLIVPSYAQVANPSTGDTIAKYCSSGTCHTAPVPVPSKAVAGVKASTVGTVKLSQPCIGKSCSQLKQLVQKGKIGIQLSNVCLTDLKNHLNSTCPLYSQLKPYDNTNPLYAGEWTDQPYTHRLAPKVKNHENFNPNPWVVMVDPNGDYAAKAIMITVTDKSFTWIDQNDISKQGLVMKTHADRYVSANCNEATTILPLLNDTIHYIESGCKITSYNNTKLITQKEIPFSFDNPYSTLHYQSQVSKIKSTGGLGNCINTQCNYKSPYSKW